jgi:hypothetical protein
MPELLRLIEERLRLPGRDLLFKESFIDLGLVLHPPAREERGERELGEHDELRPHAVGFAQQVHEPFHGGGARVRLVERSELGRGNLQVSSH